MPLIALWFIPVRSSSSSQCPWLGSGTSSLTDDSSHLFYFPLLSIISWRVITWYPFSRPCYTSVAFSSSLKASRNSLRAYLQLNLSSTLCIGRWGFSVGVDVALLCCCYYGCCFVVAAEGMSAVVSPAAAVVAAAVCDCFCYRQQPSLLW